MTATASEILSFLSKQSECAVERYEIACPTFGELRRSLRFMVLRLGEDDDLEARDWSQQFRALLSEWLTVPLRFDESILEALRAFGRPEAVEGRWGPEIRRRYDTACAAAKDLQHQPNLLREQVESLIRGLADSSCSYRIFCHRRARQHYESMEGGGGEALLREETFLHTVKDYREATPFQVLIKVGPLRSRGWGAVPDAIIAAPRFNKLIQVVWSGCGDEPGFGYDPASTPSDVREDAAVDDQTRVPASGGHGILWATQATKVGDDPGAGTSYDPDEDEFLTFVRLNQPQERRRAILVQIDEECGIMYPPHARVLSFDPNSGPAPPVAHRFPGENLVEGMYVVRPLLNSVELGGVHAEPGFYSEKWKARLNEARVKDADALIRRLREGGINLTHLRAATRNWCRPPSGVIHAPQQARHFEILVRTLGIEFDGSTPQGRRREQWWQHAWDEIRRSRGEAIQAGVHEQELVDEQMLLILNRLIDRIHEQVKLSDGFPFRLPDGESLQGAALFNKVLGVEEGFLAPESELKFVRELSTIEQWRV